MLVTFFSYTLEFVEWDLSVTDGAATSLSSLDFGTAYVSGPAVSKSFHLSGAGLSTALSWAWTSGSPPAPGTFSLSYNDGTSPVPLAVGDSLSASDVNGGMDMTLTYTPPAVGSATAITGELHFTDGNISVDLSLTLELAIHPPVLRVISFFVGFRHAPHLPSESHNSCA